MADKIPLVKVGFRDADGQVETLWAYQLSSSKYQLDNTPWYQYGISYKDIVEALPEPDGFPFFTKVLEKSGYRTIRVAPEEPASDEFLEGVKILGCGFEGANRKYIAIDIPPNVELQKVVDYLIKEGVRWEYADPTYEEIMAQKR